MVFPRDFYDFLCVLTHPRLANATVPAGEGGEFSISSKDLVMGQGQGKAMVVNHAG